MAHEKPEIRIAVAAHKPYWMPEDPMYVPVHAGAMGKSHIEGFCRDDEGDGGISALNPHLCELTVLYWAWKHLDAEAVGLTHYRRYFAGSGEGGILTSKEAVKLFKKAPIIVPKERNYYIETLGDHYDHTFQSTHLDLLIETVAHMSPKSTPALYRKLSGTKAHMFNMMIMRRDLLDSYCSWMFPIVEMVERSLDYSDMNAFEARAPGRLSEYLLDIWLATEKVECVECAVKDVEPVNWAKKGGSFLAAKFLGKKYVSSF